MTSTLVIGGPLSGRSRHAVSLLRHHDAVTCVDTGSPPAPGEDPELARRVVRERGSRPPGWQTLETCDLTRALLGSRRPVLVDCLPQWVRRHLTEHEAWDQPDLAGELVGGLLAELAVAARALPFDVVLVSEETSWSGVPGDSRDRLLHDLVSQVNRVLSPACDQVHAVIAGRVLDLSSAPVVG